MFVQSAPGRGFRRVLVLALTLIASGCALAESSVSTTLDSGADEVEVGVEVNEVISVVAGAEAIGNPPLALVVDPPAPAPERCLGPEPRGRWSGRSSDDDWARGLYPAREDYPDRWLALTFDDGPHPTNTPLLLDELADRGLHGTFFLTGHAIRSGTYPLIQRMVAEGHTLANHGWRHDTRMAKQVDTITELDAYIESELELTQIRVDLALMATSAEDFKAMDARVFSKLSWVDSRAEQLAAMPKLRIRHRALLDERGYGEGERPLTLEWVRPPGGNPYIGKWTSAERNSFARVVNRMGLSVVMWSHGSGDSDPAVPHSVRMDPERVAETGRKAALRGGIYVAHDRVDPEAAQALLGVIAQSGAVVVGLEDLRQAKLRANGQCP